jgi:hypothetical protein
MAGVSARSQDAHIGRAAAAPGRPAIDREQRQRERDWVERTRAAEPRAFRGLYDLAFRLVWAWSLRTTGDPDRAEALTAATLRRAFAGLDDFEGSATLGGWLLRHAEAVLREEAVSAAAVRGPALAEERS